MTGPCHCWQCSRLLPRGGAIVYSTAPRHLQLPTVFLYECVSLLVCSCDAVIFSSKQIKRVDVERNTDGCGCRSRSCAGSLRTVRGRRLRRWWRRRWLTVRYEAKAPWLWESSWAPPAGLHANQLCAWFPSPRKNFTTQRIAMPLAANAEKYNTVQYNCLRNDGGTPLAAASSCVTDFWLRFCGTGNACGALHYWSITYWRKLRVKGCL